MSLLPLARRMVPAVAGEDQGEAEPASPAPPMPATDDVVAAVAEAQELLTRACDDPAVQRDPYRSILAGLAAVLGVFLKSMRRWEGAVAEVVTARNPLSTEERAALVQEVVQGTKEGARLGIRQEGRAIVHGLHTGQALRIGALIGAAFVVGCGLTLGTVMYLNVGPFRPEVEAGAAWRDLIQSNPDPRAALAHSEVKADATGRRYYSGVSLWLDPSRAPPRP